MVTDKISRAAATVEALTEVSDLGVHVGVQQDVLGLEVPVHHHVPVAVVHGGDDLLKQPSALLLVQLGGGGQTKRGSRGIRRVYCVNTQVSSLRFSICIQKNYISLS